MVDVDLASLPSPSGDMLSMPSYGTALSPELQDAWLRFRMGENHSMTVGQQKDPFDYFYQEYSRDQMFLERPYLSGEPFAPRRQVGVRYSGHTASDKVGWDAMLSNGNGTGSLGDDNDEFAWSGRVYIQTPGFFGSGMTALPGRYEGLRYGIGVAAHDNEVGSTMVCEGSLAQTCGYATDNLSAFEVFGGVAGTRVRANFSWQSWSQDNAGFNPAGGPDELQLDSCTVEVGAWVGDHSEVALRYESWTTDPLDTIYTGELQSEYETTALTAGFNYYFTGNHDLKLQINVGQFEMAIDDRLDISDPLEALAAGDFIRGRTEAKSNFIRIGIQHAF
ncbi:MAG: porin [Acidobacteriota bacterium]|nr:porin [Acidobacteriota bacterium]